MVIIGGGRPCACPSLCEQPRLELGKRTAHQEFVAATRVEVIALQRGLDEYLDQLQALRALFEASDDVTRPEFELRRPAALPARRRSRICPGCRASSARSAPTTSCTALPSAFPNYRIRAVTPNDGIVIARAGTSTFRSSIRRCRSRRASTASISCRKQRSARAPFAGARRRQIVGRAGFHHA